MRVLIVFLSELEEDVEGVDESADRQQHIDETNEEDVGDKASFIVDGLFPHPGQHHWHSDGVYDLTHCYFDPNTRFFFGFLKLPFKATQLNDDQFDQKVKHCDEDRNGD